MATYPVRFKELLEAKSATRKLRAYSFLNSTLQSVKAGDTVRDALDCFIPFLAAAAADQYGGQIDLQEVQGFLRTRFGFLLPIYAIERIMSAVADRGFVEYDRTIRAYTCSKKNDNYLNDQVQLRAGYDDVEATLGEFAAGMEFDAPPASDSWVDALIAFLKSKSEENPPDKTASIKGVLIKNALAVEGFVVGRYIEDISRTRPQLYEVVLSVFKGVLIEEFVGTVQEISVADKINDLVIYYDTSILLRLVGCSGEPYATATRELHRYLQDLGCGTKFLPLNEHEADNIVATIIGVADSGGDLFGETAEAIERGEVSVGFLRVLQGQLVEQLARYSVFEEKSTGVMGLKEYQIDEPGFSRYIAAEALKKGYPTSRRTERTMPRRWAL
jgi:hypothetical protein